MPIFARIRMTWTHGALWAYDADREEIRYRGRRVSAVRTWPFPRPGHASSSQPAMGEPEDEEEDPEEKKSQKMSMWPGQMMRWFLMLAVGDPRILKEC
ncbi:hypothetical protein SESBI_36328 [Sesbania bispinosa]|nr:hypothetical protein SESBI_36328 [Sesbania bispinosa]